MTFIHTLVQIKNNVNFDKDQKYGYFLASANKSKDQSMKKIIEAKMEWGGNIGYDTCVFRGVPPQLHPMVKGVSTMHQND